MTYYVTDESSPDSMVLHDEDRRVLRAMKALGCRPITRDEYEEREAERFGAAPPEGVDDDE